MLLCPIPATRFRWPRPPNAFRFVQVGFRLNTVAGPAHLPPDGTRIVANVLVSCPGVVSGVVF